MFSLLQVLAAGFAEVTQYVYIVTLSAEITQGLEVCSGNRMNDPFCTLDGAAERILFDGDDVSITAKQCSVRGGHSGAKSSLHLADRSTNSKEKVDGTTR